MIDKMWQIFKELTGISGFTADLVLGYTSDDRLVLTHSSPLSSPA